MRRSIGLFLKTTYFIAVGIACFTVVHAVAIARLHEWERQVFHLPIGYILGWTEVLLFSFLGLASFYFAGKKYRELLQNAG